MMTVQLWQSGECGVPFHLPLLPGSHWAGAVILSLPLLPGALWPEWWYFHCHYSQVHFDRSGDTFIAITPRFTLTGVVILSLPLLSMYRKLFVSDKNIWYQIIFCELFFMKNNSLRLLTSFLYSQHSDRCVFCLLQMFHIESAVYTELRTEPFM